MPDNKLSDYLICKSDFKRPRNQCVIFPVYKYFPPGKVFLLKL